MKKGFTIVELVVIIVVLALLASISTIGYQGWRQSASRDAVQTDLQAASHAMKQYRNFNNVYPTNEALKNTYSGQTVVTIKLLDSGKNFCLTGVGGNPETTLYWDSRTDSVSETAC